MIVNVYVHDYVSVYVPGWWFISQFLQVVSGYSMIYSWRIQQTLQSWLLFYDRCESSPSKGSSNFWTLGEPPWSCSRMGPQDGVQFRYKWLNYDLWQTSRTRWWGFKIHLQPGGTIPLPSINAFAFGRYWRMLLINIQRLAVIWQMYHDIIGLARK